MFLCGLQSLRNKVRKKDSSKLQCVIGVKRVPEDGRGKKREKRDLLNSDK